MSRGVVLVVLSCAAIVHAQPNPRAAELFEQGRDLARQGQYAAACQRFAESFALDHAPGTQLNLADCHEHQGHLAIAWHFYDAAATEFKRLDDVKREAYAREHADALLGKLATIVVKLAKPGAGINIRVGGREVTAASDGTVTDHFDPGDVTIEVEAPGKPTFSRTSSGAAGATVLVEVPAFDAAVVDKPTQVLGPRRRSRVILAAAIGGGGIALLGTGIAIGLVARGNYRTDLSNEIAAGHCANDDNGLRCDSIGYAKINSDTSLANVGTGFAVAGIAAAVVGAVVFFTAPRDVVVAPAISGRDASVSLTVHF